MRETKVQTISRLKREKEELKNIVKIKTKEIRELKKETKQCIDINKTSHKLDMINFNKEINRLTVENDKLQKYIYDLEEEIKGLKIRLKNHNKTKEEINHEESMKIFEEELLELSNQRLEYWEMGCFEDKYGCKFIDPVLLTLNINPNTGERLQYFTNLSIVETIEDNPLYIKKMDEYHKFIEEVHREIEIEQFINDTGRELYETLYKDFPFENYVM